MSTHGLRSRVYKGAGLLVIGAALAATTGCGSGSGGGSTGQGGGPGVATAEAVAQKTETRPTNIGLTKPIGKPVATGKKVVFISCGVEACEILGNII